MTERTQSAVVSTQSAVVGKYEVTAWCKGELLGTT